jgi:hypothetical protein
VKLQFKKRRLIPVALAILVLVVGSGVAYAFWTAGGGGSGTAQAGTTVPLIVNQTGPAITGLYPGGPAQTLSGNFDNSNPGAIRVGSVTAVVASVSGTCLPGDFVVGGSAPVNAEVASGLGVGSWTGLTIRLTDTALDQNACKGATVNLTYSAS